MSVLPVPPPRLPEPPREYSANYMNSLIRAIYTFMLYSMNPGEGRNTLIVLTNTPTDDVGLEAGTVYNHENVLKISALNVASLRGASATGYAGTVTVSV